MTAGGQKKRWAMVFSLFVAFVLCNLDKVNMSVAIVPMAESFGWTATQKGLVSSAFFWGYSFTQIPGGWLASKYGGKAVLFYGVMLWSLGTLIAPWCAALGMPALLASRFLVGLGEGVAPAAATGVLAKGVPPSQRSKAVTTAFGGLDVGSLSGLLIAPPIIFHLGGWPAVFYLFGILGFFWGAWWFVSFMRDSSTDMKETAAPGEKKSLNIPWGAFTRNPQFWALTVAHFTWNYFSYGLLAWLPSFLASAMGVTLSKSSFLSILPYLSTVIMTAIIAPLAGKLEADKTLTRTQIRKGSQTLCFGVGAHDAHRHRSHRQRHSGRGGDEPNHWLGGRSPLHHLWFRRLHPYWFVLRSPRSLPQVRVHHVGRDEHGGGHRVHAFHLLHRSLPLPDRW